MHCYRCESEVLELAALWPYERKTYVLAGVVLRICMNCGLEQSHMGDDEILEPAQAAEAAPPKA